MSLLSAYGPTMLRSDEKVEAILEKVGGIAGELQHFAEEVD